MKTTIASIRRFGSRYVVTLTCGHKYKLPMTKDELASLQLFIGMPVTCGESHKPNQP